MKVEHWCRVWRLLVPNRPPMLVFFVFTREEAIARDTCQMGRDAIN